MFEPDFADPSDWALLYRGLNLQVVPAAFPAPGTQWKRPIVKWREHENTLVDDGTFNTWFPPSMPSKNQMGIITGACSGIFVVDLDTHKGPSAMQWWNGLLEVENYGVDLETAIVTTGGGGKQYYFRTPDGWTPPTNKTAIGVDIRGQGGFVMAPPSLHESGREYVWDAGCEPWDTGLLEAPQWLCDAIDKLVASNSQDRSSAPEYLPGPVGSSGITENFFGHVVDGREEYATKLVWAAVVGWWRECPIKPSADESAEKSRENWLVYERHVEARAKKSNTPKAVLLESEGRGYTMWAEKWKHAMSQWDGKVAMAGAEGVPQRPFAPKQETSETPELAMATLATEPTRFFGLDLDDIPPRRWVYGRENLVGFVSVLGGQGGVGKSAYAMVQAFSVALGRTLLPRAGREMFHKPHLTGAVWYINGEDPLEEIKRRGAAIIKHYGIKASNMMHEIYMDSGRDRDFIVTTRDAKGHIITAPVVEAMIEAIKARGIRLLIVDPFANSHTAEENRTDEMGFVMRLWAQVANDADCAVYLLHHMRKGTISPGDADQFRGSSAVQGAARVMSTMVAMSELEAEKLGLDPDTRRQYIRLDNAKASMSPVPEGATWFRLVSVPLSDDPNIDNGAQVVTTWEPPKAFDDFPMSMAVRILDLIHSGFGEGERYAVHPQSDRWAGTILMEKADKNKKQATEILNSWVDNGLITVEDYASKANKSRPRPGIFVNITKLAEMRNSFQMSRPEE